MTADRKSRMRAMLEPIRASARFEKKTLAQQVLTYVVSFCILLLIWQIASMVINAMSHNELLPGPYRALSQVVKNAAELRRHFAASALRLVAAIATALFVAVPLGLVVGRERLLDRFLSPMLYITYPIPQVALILVLFIIFGAGNVTMVAMVALVLVFQILMSARGAAKNLDEDHITSVVSAGASRWQVYRHVVLPATIPDILTSLRVSIGLGVAFLYIAETTIMSNGLGFYIKKHMLFARDLAFAGIITLAVLGLILYLAIDALEHILCRWKHVRRKP